MGRRSTERRRRGLGRRSRRIHEGEKYKGSDKGDEVRLLRKFKTCKYGGLIVVMCLNVNGNIQTKP